MIETSLLYAKNRSIFINRRNPYEPVSQTKWEDVEEPDRWLICHTRGMFSQYRYLVVKRWNCTTISELVNRRIHIRVILLDTVKQILTERLPKKDKNGGGHCGFVML